MIDWFSRLPYKALSGLVSLFVRAVILMLFTAVGLGMGEAALYSLMTGSIYLLAFWLIKHVAMRSA